MMPLFEPPKTPSSLPEPATAGPTRPYQPSAERKLMGQIMGLAFIELVTIGFYGLGLVLLILMSIPLARTLKELRTRPDHVDTPLEQLGRIALMIVVVQSVAVAGFTATLGSCTLGSMIAFGAMGSGGESIFIVAMLLSIGILPLSLWGASKAWMHFLMPAPEFRPRASPDEVPEQIDESHAPSPRT
ncbi:hypothetical protein [Stratiformator vulcanicus]|uniref:Uncharacterized protein n=1 Tax=Stratiformator vulcanicus TaxID=2527980 RepID=A0A517R7F3_9PLAN|nr:hypothetical protein [Stratiformator vulcanicus]QDT39820.1 hypothetical protein Pan189_42320 [Stratiformator vulcanicus]